MATKHICGGPVFGRFQAGCPRCDELIAGAPATVWGTTRKRQMQAEQIRAIRAHRCAESKCGPVCTFGDW